jgi:hypothetical protein
MFEISVHNAYQDASQGNYTDFSNNLSFEPTVDELNRNTSHPGGVSEGQEIGGEPLFGEHIR